MPRRTSSSPRTASRPGTSAGLGCASWRSSRRRSQVQVLNLPAATVGDERWFFGVARDIEEQTSAGSTGSAATCPRRSRSTSPIADTSSGSPASSATRYPSPASIQPSAPSSRPSGAADFFLGFFFAFASGIRPPEDWSERGDSGPGPSWHTPNDRRSRRSPSWHAPNDPEARSAPCWHAPSRRRTSIADSQHGSVDAKGRGAPPGKGPGAPTGRAPWRSPRSVSRRKPWRL